MDSVIILQMILTIFIASCFTNIAVLLYRNSRDKARENKRHHA